MRAANYINGPPENVFIDDTPIPTLKDGEVLVRIIGSAINRADTLQRQGKYDPPAGESKILGLEAAGIIHEFGPECVGTWKIGDRVMALLPGGGNAEFVAALETHLMKVPTNLSLIEAASIPETWLTAYQMLHLVGRVRTGDFVLIHAGGSGVAAAAIQLCLLMNAKPIVTAGSQEKVDFAKSLGAIEGFNYKEKKFGEEIKAITNGIGVNVILDCIGGSFCEENLKAIAADGSWVFYGAMGGIDVTPGFIGQIISKRLKIEGTTLRNRSKQYKSNLIKEFSLNILPHFEDKNKLRPIIDSIFPLGKLGEAHKRMEDNKNIGKILLQIQCEERPVSVAEEY